jgi:hypothetical protein
VTCHDARDQFSALVDDALTPGGRAAVDAHLVTCADCRRELQRFRDTVALVRAVGPARAPAGFVDRVLEAARPVPWYRQLARGLFLPWPVKLPMEAAAIVLVAIGVALVYRGAPELGQSALYDQGMREMPRQAPEALAPPPQREADVRHEAQDAREMAQAKDQMPSAASPAIASSSAAPPPAPAPPAEVARQLARPPAGKPQQPAERREKKDAQATAKLEAPPAATEGERAQALPDVQQSYSAPPAPKARADASGAKQSAPPVAALTFAPPAVSGRLAVTDRDAALRAVVELAKRLGAVETRRADIADGQLLELTVPREAYAEFIRELAGLGRWQPSAEPAELPAQVRLVLQITR